MKESLLTIAEVARRLVTDEPTVAQLIERGDLRALSIAPGEFRILPGDYVRFVHRRRAEFQSRRHVMA